MITLQSGLESMVCILNEKKIHVQTEETLMIKLENGCERKKVL